MGVTMFDLKKETEIIASAFYSHDRFMKLLDYPLDIFHSDSHRYLIQCMIDMNDNGVEVDTISFTTHLKQLGTIEKYKDTLENIITSNYSMSIDNELIYIKNLYLKKRLYEASEDFKAGKYDFDSYYSEINNIYAFMSGSDYGRIDFQEFLQTELDDIFTESSYVPSGIAPLDDKIRGFFNGQLIIIAARPGVGKSTLAWQIAQNINEGVLFLSKEMGRSEMYAKSLSAKSVVPVDQIESKEMNSEERKRVMETHLKLQESMKVILYDKPMSISKTKNIIKKEVQRGAKIVFIDYLQLITGGRGNNANERIQGITQGLKNLARELNIPIVLLSQLNREVEKSKRFPILSDLRDSGAIEQDADVVIFIHEQKDENAFEDSETFVIISKGRKIKTGKLIDNMERSVIMFNKKYSKFSVINYDMPKFEEQEKEVF